MSGFWDSVYGGGGGVVREGANIYLIFIYLFIYPPSVYLIFGNFVKYQVTSHQKEILNIKHWYTCRSKWHWTDTQSLTTSFSNLFYLFVVAGCCFSTIYNSTVYLQNRPPPWGYYIIMSRFWWVNSFNLTNASRSRVILIKLADGDLVCF